jgi:hypothetical protein
MLFPGYCTCLSQKTFLMFIKQRYVRDHEGTFVSLFMNCHVTHITALRIDGIFLLLHATYNICYMVYAFLVSELVRQVNPIDTNCM